MSKNLTPLKAIRKKCLECSCFSPKEVRLCPITDCALYEYRFGHNPARKGVGQVKAEDSTGEITEKTPGEMTEIQKGVI
ncbi:MAG: hypothetical protein WC352_02450 [Candidatus Omnitrophota bacterium]|jgi:hypothetical protein